MRRGRPRYDVAGRALLALVAGALIYLLTRDPQSVQLIHRFSLPLWSGELLPCAVCGPLPSLLHVYAFILLSAFVLQPGSQRQLAALCLAWYGTESLFELGQIEPIARLIHQFMPESLSAHSLLSITDRYFLFGTFDLLDLLFIGLGAVAAYWWLAGTIPLEVQHEQSEDHKQTSG